MAVPDPRLHGAMCPCTILNIDSGLDAALVFPRDHASHLPVAPVEGNFEFPTLQMRNQSPEDVGNWPPNHRARERAEPGFQPVLTVELLS